MTDAYSPCDNGPASTQSVPPGDAFPRSDICHPIPHRFEAFARRDPDRIAVEGREARISYRALDDRANSIACALVELGGAPGDVVAVLLDKAEPELVAAFLGVLKAGRIHVALSPAAAPQHHRRILEDCGASILLTDALHWRSARSVSPQDCILARIDRIAAGTAQEPPAITLEPEAPALLIYTSGSTGQPKGVLWSHRNFLYSVQVMSQTLGMRTEDRVAHLASMNVFAGPRDTLAASLNGASLALYDLDARGVGELGPWLRSRAITYANMVVTVFRHFAATLAPGERFPSMRILRISAETLSAAELEVFDRHCGPGCRLRVGFATTETGNVTQALIGHATPLETVLWGRALDGMEVLILDDRRRTLDCGEIGALAVRSRYLADGYWRQPEITEQAFIPDPSGGDCRIYLTGDLARMRCDGSLEYLGRRDRMIKIRGAKVFLDAVEKELMRIPGIRQAAAEACADPSKNTRLIAYVALTSPGALSVQTIRERLRGVLPQHSVPAFVVELPVLPATAQGKIDRRALPLPDWRERPAAEFTREPGSAVEHMIAAIWAHVLDLDTVGTTDRFIDLGGDSLQAGRIAAGINSTFGVEIDLISLLDADTVEEMASVVNGTLARRAAATHLRS